MTAHRGPFFVMMTMARQQTEVPRVALLMQGERHYERELLRGISDFANLHGPWEVCRNLSYLSGEDVDPAELIRLWRPDAIVLRESSPHRYDSILGTELPMIYSPVTECREGLAHIVVNDAKVGALAADHLHEAGFRFFAYCGVRSFFWSRRRGEGFSRQIEGHGYPARVFDSRSGREFFSWSPGHSRLIRWLRKLPKPVGVFCCTDDFSLLVQEACGTAGLRIPDDVGLIGVGNDESICELARVRQSSVELNLRRGGYDAARHLSELIDGRRTGRCQPRHIVVEPIGVVARLSTDTSWSRDPEVAKALAFIHKRLHRPLEVKEVVCEVNLSRRRLYDRFRASTGKSLSAYIRDRRLASFARLLIETNLTVSEIAYAMGYESETNIARSFKKHFGMPPAAYRRQHGGQVRD